jgi:hypothetical protein
MKITVKARNIELVVDDGTNETILYTSRNDEAIKMVKVLVAECINIIKESTS